MRTTTPAARPEASTSLAHYVGTRIEVRGAEIDQKVSASRSEVCNSEVLGGGCCFKAELKNLLAAA